MATSRTPQSFITNLDEGLDRSVKTQQNLAESIDTFKDINLTMKDTGKEFENIQSLSTQLNNMLKETLTLQSRLGKEYIKINEIQKDINHLTGQRERVEKQISISISKALQFNPSVKANAEAVLKLKNSIAEKEGQLNDLISQNLTGSAAKKAITAIENDILKDMLKQETLLKKAGVNKVSLLMEQAEVAKQVVKTLEESIPMQEKINAQIDMQKQKLGALGALIHLIQGISKIPILGNYIQTQKILDAMDDTMKRTNNKWATLATGMKGIGNEIMRVLSDPIIVAGILLEVVYKLVSGVFELDKNITNTANSLGVTKEFTQSIYKDFQGISLQGAKVNENLNNGLLSISNQGKAMNELNTAFGTAVGFTDMQIQDQIFLTKQMGMQGDEAKGIMQLSVLTGKSASETLKTINKQNDGLLSYRKIIGEVSKISGQLLAQYKNSPEQLAKAVVEANKLGISLDQAKKISDTLLNFQSSIENEMEAELITGKQLNLERARALSLAGDSAGAAKEMLQQVGSLSEYSALNVIQQQSLAKAVGMTAGEMTNALREQETLTKLGAKSKEDLQAQYDHLIAINDQRGLSILKTQLLAKENGDLLLKNISQMSLQQRFEASVERMKEIFVSIASGPLMSMLNGIAKMLENTAMLKTILVATAAVVGGIAASIITAAFAVNPIAAGIGAAIGAGVAATAIAYTKVNDSVINPQGQVMISTPAGGLVIPRKDDSIITTNNPSGLLSGGGGGSTKGVEDKLDQMIRLLQKGGNVYMDSKHIGTTLALSYNSYA